MSTVRRIMKNTGILFLADFISKIFMFFFVMYTARYLGAEGFGILSFALAFTRLFGVFVNLGLPQLTIREVARNKLLASKYLGNVLAMKMISTAITFGLIVLTINLLGYPDQTIKVVYLIALFIIFDAFILTFDSIFKAFESMKYPSIGQIMNSILLLLGSLFAIKYGLNVVSFALLFTIASFIVLLYSLIIYTWKFDYPKMEVDWIFWKRAIKEALPFGLTGTLITMYYWIDSIMLSLMQGNEVVGFYNAAYRVALVLLAIPMAVNGAINPILSQFYTSSRSSLIFVFEKHFKYMLIIGFPIGVGITLLADNIIFFVFGADYVPSVIALQILIWSIVLIFARTAFERVLESANRQMIVTKVFGFCTFLNVILNIVLIPKYSYIGAAVATLITDFAVFAIIFIWSRKIGFSIPNKQLVEVVNKVIPASLLIGVFIVWFKSLSLLLLVPLVTIVYVGVIILIKGISDEDMAIFRKIVRKKSIHVSLKNKEGII